MDRYQKLRDLAEEKLCEKDHGIHKLPKEIDELIHELQVHQIELEMQNDELQHSRTEIEELHQKYYDLYNSAPAGYITMDMATRIAEINIIGAKLLGIDQTEKHKYIFNLFISIFQGTNVFVIYFFNTIYLFHILTVILFNFNFILQVLYLQIHHHQI